MIRQYERLIHQGELPRLEIVAQERILFHEEVEPIRVARVASRLVDEGRLRHPPIVGAAKKGEDLLLVDGAHRISALRQLGFPYALAQIIDYDDPLVELSTWHHLLRLTDCPAFLRFIESLPGVTAHRRACRPEESPFRRAPGQLAGVILPDRSVLHACVGPRTSLKTQVELLGRIVGWYKADGFLDRISYDEFDWLSVNYPAFSALVTFRIFTKDEVRRLGRDGRRLPAGITRHLVTKRTLRLNLPLDLLRADASLEQRNTSLAALILERSRQGRIRFYTESTFSFDE